MTADRSLELPRSAVSRRVLAELGRTGRCAVDGPIHVPPDAVCRLLSNGRRRLVIGEIAALDTDERAALGDLAERVAGTEHGLDPSRVAAGQRKSVYVSLLQCHLPKLDDADVVEWDRRSGAVARGRSIDELASLIDAIERVCSIR
jgi:hypothetical protein